jgi:hypothetical protein
VCVVPWLADAAALMRSELFKDKLSPKVLALTIVRGSDVSKCIQRYADHLKPQPVVVTSSSSSSSSSPVTAVNSDEMGDMVYIMRQCFQSDKDVEDLVNAVRDKFGPMRVYLTGLQHTRIYVFSFFALILF